MIKQIVYILVMLIAVLGCDSDTATECFRTTGATVTYDVEVPEFINVHTSPGIELVIKQGEAYKVTVKTGENLRKYISAQVMDGELRLENRNNCNWVRDYNSTTVYVTTPQLYKIISASQFAVRSDGVLNFPDLLLMTEVDTETPSGIFDVEVNCSWRVTANSNQMAYFRVRGYASEVGVYFYSGDSRFDGSGLQCDKLDVFHRSSNDIIAKPALEAKGKLMSTGNLVLKSQPEIVEVEQVYLGSVVYE
jgi:hypothetical protein